MVEDKEDKATTASGLNSILKEVKRMVPEMNPKDSVTQFAALRPARDPAGYSIRAFDSLYGYIEVNGISQGVSCSPAVSVYVTQLLNEQGLELVRKTDFNPYRRRIARFCECTPEEQERLLQKDPRYGNIICRCEKISEAEIVEAIRRGAHSLDAVKRRVRAGMGRCQGGFCSPRVVEILAGELGIPAETIRKNEPGSEILSGVNRE